MSMLNPTVDSVVKGLMKTVEKLEAVSEAKSAEIDKCLEKERTLADQRSAAADEACRADRIAKKVRELVS